MDWKVGQPAPTMITPDNLDIDTFDHADDKVEELDMDDYGDDYDPTAPAKVRTVPWTMDTDEDGDKN